MYPHNKKGKIGQEFNKDVSLVYLKHKGEGVDLEKSPYQFRNFIYYRGCRIFST